MNPRFVFGTILIGFIGLTLIHSRAPLVHGQDRDEPAQAVVDAARALSETTLKDGGGWKAYEKYLHPKFNRWSAGGEVIDRDRSVELIREWWEAGNRQSSSDSKTISVQIVGNTAVLRKQVEEKYIDSEGADTGSFSGYVTQVWLRSDGQWKLLAATIQRGENE